MPEQHEPYDEFERYNNGEWFFRINLDQGDIARNWAEVINVDNSPGSYVNFSNNTTVRVIPTIVHTHVLMLRHPGGVTKNKIV